LQQHFDIQKNTISFDFDNYDPTQTLIIDPSLEWATYYGGGDGEYQSSCAVDGFGNVYLAGKTQSSNNISENGHLNTFGGDDDAFLVKFNALGIREWGTYYGESGQDFPSSCAVDGSGNVYLAGWTTSISSISENGHQNTFGGGYHDAFLVKFNSAGVRQWGTYYGGSDYDYARSCSTDNAGNVYLVGYTNSTSSIASNGHQNIIGVFQDAFLVKFNSAGVREWGTYYGGSAGDYGYSCAVDDSGRVYLAGYTSSSTDIAENGHQNIKWGSFDAFLVQFNASGVRQWATYYGGSVDDYGYSCAVDGSGYVYLAGYTQSTNAVAANGHQNTYGGGNYDAFLVKFNSSGVREWGTYYGENGYEVGFSCAVDNSSHVYLTGITSSLSGIAANGYQNTYSGNIDAFLVKFNSSGVRELGTYYGGSDEDFGRSCALDVSGNVYLAGETNSTMDISFNGYQNSFGGGSYDAFLVKFEGNNLSTTIKTIQSEDLITLFPNPTSGLININKIPQDAQELKIYNALGQMVYSSNVLFKEIDLSLQPKGLYFITLNTSNKVYTHSFIKQ
jgi:hypothetical protein